jgi:uncharacterized protein (TIGR00730 family)
MQESPEEPSTVGPGMPQGTEPSTRKPVAHRQGPKITGANHPSYLMAFEDVEFLRRDALRPVRLQLEMWKADLILREHGIRSTVCVFGSARILEKTEAKEKLLSAEAAFQANPTDPRLAKEVEITRRLLEKSRYYDEARRLASLISRACQNDSRCDFVVATGGGPGIMEAANRGAHDVGAKSIGYNIVLPFEQKPNPYISPELCFQFRYFAIRKMHFLMRARALVAFPGGYGTFDEFFDIITLIQTGKVRPIPVILCGRDFWRHSVNFEYLRDEGTISIEDLDLFHTVDTADEAWKIIHDFYALGGRRVAKDHP